MWVRRKLNNRVAALVEDGCLGGHEAIAYGEFLRRGIPRKVVDRAFLVCGESEPAEKRTCTGTLTKNNSGIVVTSSGNEVHSRFSVITLVAFIDVSLCHA